MTVLRAKPATIVTGPQRVGVVAVDDLAQSTASTAISLDRLIELSDFIREALGPLVGSAGNIAREKTVIERWRIDRNLAGRVVRSLRTTDPLSLLAELPSPEGLGILLSAARRRGCPESDLAGLDLAVKRWADLIDAHPGKRRGIMQRLAGANSTNRSKADIAARRGMFRHAAEFMGYHVRHTAAILILSPSSKAGALDATMMFGKFGLVRTREGGPAITVMGIRAEPKGPNCEFLPIQKGASGSKAESALMREFCRGVSYLELVRTTAEALELRLPSEQPPLHGEVDLVCGQRMPAVMSAVRSQDTEFEWYEAVARIPSEVMTLDVLLCPGVFRGSAPLMSSRVLGLNPPIPPTCSVPEADVLRADGTLTRLEDPIRDTYVPGIPRYSEMLDWACTQVGLRIGELQGWRVRVEYPMVMSSTTLWFALPGVDAAQSGEP